MTLTEQRKTDDGRVELFISLDRDEMNAAAAKEYSRKKNSLTVPGFRKGKAPRAVIEKIHGKFFFYDEALNSMIQDVYKNALDESGVEVIDQARITVEEMSLESGVKLIFSVMPYPELGVNTYKGLKATKRIKPVEPADIEMELNSMREKNSRLVAVEDREAKTDDIAVIDFEGFIDGEAFDGGKGEGFNLTLGSGQFIPGFEDQIIGHCAKEEFDVNVTFPEDYSAENLAGKDAVFKVNLQEIRAKELPDLDDEFTKDVSEFDTLSDLKADIEKRLCEDRDERVDIDIENQLGEQLARELDGEVPEAMISSRIDELVRDFSYRMGSQGFDLSTYLKYTNQDIEAFRDGFRENATNQVKVRLALEAVARAETITVAEEDIEAEYVKSADNYKVDVARIKEMIPSATVKRDIAANRALDYIKNNAEITEENEAAGGEEITDTDEPNT